MYRGESRVLPTILIIIITVVAILALIAIGRALFSTFNSGDEVVDDSSQRALLSTDADRSVRMTVRGPIVGNDMFNSYEIEVSPNGRRLTTYSGFDRTVVENEQLANNTEAYTEFVHALNLANFTDGTEPIDDEENMRGVCAGGRLYTFELAQSQTLSQQYWVTSCRGSAGTFRGDAVAIRSLFLRQVPNSNSMIRKLDL